MKTIKVAVLALAVSLGPMRLVQADERTVLPDRPHIPTRQFAVPAYGAKGDGETDNAAAIQKAIDAAAKGGGGTVIIPAGVWLSGPFHLASHINLEIDGTLRMLPLSRYPGGTDEPGDFISARGLEDVAITGSGSVDGQGKDWWPFAKVAGKNRPRMIVVNSCRRVLVAEVTLSNSPMFHLAFGGACADLTVHHVTVRAPASTDAVCPSHNTDACDVKGNNILIEDCDISTGDDDFTCGGNTSNVLIRNCKYGFGHGVSIGSYTRGGVSNITVENCTFHDTECGIRVKTDRDRGGYVHHLIYRNLSMTNVGCPILVYANYTIKEKAFRDSKKLTPTIAARFPAAPVTGLTPIYQDFTFSHIRATVAGEGRAGLIWGLPEMPAKGIILEDVDISAQRPFGVFEAKDVRLIHSHILTSQGVNRIEEYRAEVTEDSN